MLRKLHQAVGALLPGDMLGVSSSRIERKEIAPESSAKTRSVVSPSFFSQTASTLVKMTSIFAFLRQAAADTMWDYFNTPHGLHLYAEYSTDKKMPFAEAVESIREQLKAIGTNPDGYRIRSTLIDHYECYSPYVIDLYYTVARNASEIIHAGANATAEARETLIEKIAALIEYLKKTNQTSDLDAVIKVFENCTKKPTSSDPVRTYVLMGVIVAAALSIIVAHFVVEHRYKKKYENGKINNPGSIVVDPSNSIVSAQGNSGGVSESKTEKAHNKKESEENDLEQERRAPLLGRSRDSVQ